MRFLHSQRTKLLTFLSVLPLFANEETPSLKPPNDDMQSILNQFGRVRKVEGDSSQDENNEEETPVLKDDRASDTPDELFRDEETPQDENEENNEPDETDNEESNEDDNNEDKADKTFKINKVEYSEDQIIDKASEHYGFDISDMAEDKRTALINDYVTAQNFAEGRKSLNKGHQDNAAKRKELQAQERKLTNQEKEINSYLETLKEQKAELEAKLDEQIEEDDERFYDEDARMELKVEQQLAKAKIKDIEKEEKKTTDYQKASDLRKYELNVMSQIYDLQQEDTALAFEGDIVRLLNQYSEGVINTETIKAAVVSKIFNDYESEKVKPKDIQSFYRSRKKYYASLLPDKDTAQPKSKPADNEDDEETSDKIKNKQKNYPPMPKSPASPFRSSSTGGKPKQDKATAFLTKVGMRK